MPQQSICYGLYNENNEIVAFLGVIHQPNINPKIKRVTRLVVLPDYQGIGLGTRFLECVAEIYKKQGYDFSIVTSAKNLIHSLNKNKKWTLIRHSVNKIPKNSKIDSLRKTIRNNCKTASFFYKGGV